MNLCRYNTSKPCENHGTSSRTCLDCIFDKIIAEIEEHETYEGVYLDRYDVLEIIDKYKAESGDKE